VVEEVVKEEIAIEEKTPVNQLDSLTALAKQETDSLTQAQQQAEWEKNFPLFSKLQIQQQDGQLIPSPIVGTAAATDTAQINRWLAMRQVREMLPRTLQLKWTVKAVDERGRFFQLIAIRSTSRDGRPALEGDVITDARADIAQGSAYASVSMSMNNEGAKVWARLTKENIGRSIAIVLDNYVYSFPTVNTEIPNGNSSITGNFTPEEAQDLANTLKSGKMPAPARIVQEDVIGPSLGQEAIHDGFVSFVVAFICIMLYMFFYYGKKPGLVASTALLANLFLLVGILAAFKATLTLPGIAGIVLTLGMAVDANVLIYERIREELAIGKNAKKAVEDGFKNAFSAIFDANLTTLLVGIILIMFGTGPVKGFAVTLSWGIFTSFVTAVFLTRLMLENMAAKEKLNDTQFTTNFTKNFLQNLNIDFTGLRKIGYAITGAIIIISAVSFATLGFNQGIDFSGGRNYTIQFNNAFSTEDVREALQMQFEGETSLNVITIGNNNQVRVSTNYKIMDNSDGVAEEIEGKLYDGLKPFIGDTSFDTFKSQNILSSQTVGPTIASDIRVNAIWAVLFAIIGISLYILFRFKDVAFSLGSVASLAQVALVVIAAYSLLYRIMPFTLEVNQHFVAAILTAVAYAINDTVVIFDRIRENIGLYPKRERSWIVNKSINATMSRTFSTTFSTFLVLLLIFIFGGDVIRGFVFALMIGVVAGVYSTIFIASPVAYDFNRWREKKKGNK
ncbi:MAG: protein translocase subunit SecD, partial [Prevotellaceae bacterium]|jgi:SecD/SecF fusion protein|nr:protein translocase subunit SecD [Prevotellaceae bacterium]